MGIPRSNSFTSLKGKEFGRKDHPPIDCVGESLAGGGEAKSDLTSPERTPWAPPGPKKAKTHGATKKKGCGHAAEYPFESQGKNEQVDYGSSTKQTWVTETHARK